MSTKILSPKDARRWRSKIADTVDASPLIFAKADEATSPFVLEVTNGQAPGGGKTLIIHVIKRADIDPAKAVEVVQHALNDVFGKNAGEQADCDYRNVSELKKLHGEKHIVNEAHDSMTVIFGPGPVAYTRNRDWVRDAMAVSLKKWYERSLTW